MRTTILLKVLVALIPLAAGRSIPAYARFARDVQRDVAEVSSSALATSTPTYSNDAVASGAVAQGNYTTTVNPGEPIANSTAFLTSAEGDCEDDDSSTPAGTSNPGGPIANSTLVSGTSGTYGGDNNTIDDGTGSVSEGDDGDDECDEESGGSSAPSTGDETSDSDSSPEDDSDEDCDDTDQDDESDDDAGDDSGDVQSTGDRGSDNASSGGAGDNISGGTYRSGNGEANPTTSAGAASATPTSTAPTSGDDNSSGISRSPAGDGGGDVECGGVRWPSEAGDRLVNSYR